MAILLVIVIVLLGLIGFGRAKGFFDRFSGLDWKTWCLGASQSFILSLSIGWLVWRWFSRYPQPFNELVSGYLAFTHSVKTSEFYGLYAAILGFVISLLVIGQLYKAAADAGATSKSAILRLSLYSLIPSAILLGQSLRLQNTNYLLALSAGTILLSLGVAGILYFLLLKNIIQEEETFDTGAKLILGILFLVLSDAGAAILMTRIGYLTYRFGSITVVALVILVLLGALDLKFRFFSIKQGIDLFYMLSQLGIPLIFLVFISPVAVLKDGSHTFLQYHPSLYWIVAAFVSVTYIDLIRRYVKNRAKDFSKSDFSPWIGFAILLFVHSYPVSWPVVGSDNFHYGEFYLPFWQMREFGYLPFIDYQPARGLLNYLPGFFSWLFYDGTFSGQALFALHSDAVYLMIGYFGLRWTVGDLGAFLSIFSMYLFQGNLNGGLVIAISVLSVICKTGERKSPVLTLWIWLVLSLATTMFVVAEGALSTIASIPLAVYLLVQSFLKERKRLLISIAGFIGAALILIITTRFGEMTLGIVRYLIEQSGVNDIAHGIPWMVTPLASQAVTTGYFWQFIRYSWLLLLIPIVVELITRKKDNAETSGGNLRVLWLIAVFLIAILIIPRADGRVDADAFSRPGLVSIGMVMSALPLIVLPRVGDPMKRVGVVLGLALLFGLMGNQEMELRNARLVTRAALNEPMITVSGASLGLKNIGSSSVIGDDQLNRQVQIKKTLDRLLKPDDTYFDATNNTADYGYQGRPSPVADPAPYNTPADIQQLRMIDQIEKKQVSLVLLKAEQNIFDGGPLSLRDYWLYRYLLDRFTPFVNDAGFIWMVRKGQEKLLDGTEYKIVPEQSLSYLTSALWQEDISGLPGSWGASFDQLKSKLGSPVNLLSGIGAEMNGIRQVDARTIEVTGSPAYLILEVPPGQKGDLLYIATAAPIQGSSMQTAWVNDLVPDFTDLNHFVFAAGFSRYLIPLSSAPSWALGKSAQRIKIQFPDSFRGSVTFEQLVLFERISGR